MLQVLRVVAVVLFTVVVGSVGYAYAASNTGLSGPGGDGVGAISGYSVENVSYSLNSIDPTRIDAVSFDLDAGALSDVPPVVKVKLVSASDTWHACAIADASASSRAICMLPAPIAVADVNELRVVAAQ